MGIPTEPGHQIQPYTTLASVALSTIQDEPVPSLLPPSAGEVLREICSCNHQSHCYTNHPQRFHDTHETPLKQLQCSGDTDHTETPNQQHQSVQNGNPKTGNTEHNSTTSNGESFLNVSPDTPVSSGTEIDPTLNEESFVNQNHDNQVISDAGQSLLDQDNHQPSSANSTSASEQSTISLHENPPGVRGMLGILHVRNFHNLAARVRYDLESISLNHGSYTGPSFSIPSSAGVQISLNEEQDIAPVHQNVSPLNQPDDIESRYLHTRVYT